MVARSGNARKIDDKSCAKEERGYDALTQRDIKAQNYQDGNKDNAEIIENVKGSLGYEMDPLVDRYK